VVEAWGVVASNPGGRVFRGRGLCGLFRVPSGVPGGGSFSPPSSGIMWCLFRAFPRMGAAKGSFDPAGFGAHKTAHSYAGVSLAVAVRVGTARRTR
jgi:hypothetical protein